MRQGGERQDMEFFRTEKASEHITRIIGASTEYMYLVQGSEKAVLIDTGIGAGNLREFVEGLTSLPLNVLLTHGHLDHAGGSFLFDEVWVHDLDRELIREHYAPEAALDYIRSCVGEAADEITMGDMVQPCDISLRSLEYGQKFDLGGISVEVLPGGGHTPGSVCFLFPEERTLLTGDACNTFGFLFMENSLPIEVYKENLLELKKRECEWDRLYQSHNQGEVKKELLDEVIEACDDILNDRAWDQSFRFGDLQAWIAEEVQEGNVRADGKLGNIAYRKDNLYRTYPHWKQTLAKWDVQEVVFLGPSEGNPFRDYQITGTFTGAQECVSTDGFYDGNGIYKLRFMPSFEGTYTWQAAIKRTGGTDAEMIGQGSFTVGPAKTGSHGPVRVVNQYHFAYEDGTPYYSIGTTCYVWELQSDGQIRRTLETLRDSAFNKIRFCIFPKHYDYNLGEPRSYPYEGTPMDSSVLTRENFWDYTGKKEGNHFDLFRFNPGHFAHIEKCIRELAELGIEADLIVMHPYDRWGFSGMTAEQDDFYWNYVIARFAAFHNVWWSLANEYDLFREKSLADWERYAKIICEKDPYHHLRSIHNCMAFYDYSRPWITHCSIQRQDLYKSAELVNEWRTRYGKPVVLDEIAYEGNIQHGWGNISPEEMVRRFWEGAVRGGYPGHGETYMSPDDLLWWSHGGMLKGESHKRFHLLLSILKETPGIGLRPYEKCGWDEVCAVPEDPAEKLKPMPEYYLYYYSFMRPSFREFYFDDETEFRVKVIDTWDMTVKDEGVRKGKFRVALPGKPYMAVQIKKI